MKKYLVLAEMYADIGMGKLPKPEGTTMYIAYDSYDQALEVADGAQILELESNEQSN